MENFKVEKIQSRENIMNFNLIPGSTAFHGASVFESNWTTLVS